MLPKPIIDILTQFDDLLGAVNTLNDNNKDIEDVGNEIKLLKLWREEIESEKQSIYVIGKTSTGKSEFHNFILEIDNKKDALFKTSTKVETGIIQTLQHCASRKNAFAEIIVKDKDEINRLTLPTQLNSRWNGSSLFIPLNTSENIAYFRDNIIAKSENNNSFDIIKAVEQVNIKFPLKYLKRYKLIDTPGLASSISETDLDVKEHFNGKSHVFWFLDGSKRTISDSLTLLDEEKVIIQNSEDRISFIFNKFDLMEYDDDNERKKVVSERRQELIDVLNFELDKFSVKKEKRKIYFTSFKNPKKKFPALNTHDVIKNIEDSKINIEKESHHKNIHSLISNLSKILECIKKNVIEKKLNSSEKEIKKLENKQKEIDKFKRDSLRISSETLGLIKKSKNSLNSIKKEKNLNTHKRFNNYQNKFKTQVRKSCKEIDNSVLRIEYLELKNYHKKLQWIKKVREYTFNDKETIWKKFVIDSELKQSIIDSEKYVQEKIESFDSLVPMLNNIITEECKRLLKKNDNQLSIVTEKRNYYYEQSLIIKESEQKIKDLDSNLLKDIEQRVSQWKPENTHKKLENFLALFSLLQEHNIIEQKII
jgi:hypothetical protein